MHISASAAGEPEPALVGAVLVGQELSERVGIFECRRLHRLETVALIDGADFLHHLPRGVDRGGTAILQPARQARLQFLRFFGFVSHGRRWYQRTRGAATGARFFTSARFRHGRACPGHPRLSLPSAPQRTWMPGTSPGMTVRYGQTKPRLTQQPPCPWAALRRCNRPSALPRSCRG